MNTSEIFEAPPSNAEAATASAAPDNAKEKDNTAGADAIPSASTSSTASPTPTAATGVSLEQEMSQAFGALRGFWGRSTKSFGSVVLQAQERAQVLASQATVAAATVASQATTVAQNAQREIERLGAAVDAAVEDAVTERERVAGAEAAAANMGIIGVGGGTGAAEQPVADQEIALGTQLGNGLTAEGEFQEGTLAGEEAGGFLARLQAGLPPNVAQTIKALEAAASSGEAALATRAKELQAQLAPTLQRVQTELGAAGTKAQEGLAIAQTRAQGGIAAAQEGLAPTLARMTSEVGKVQAELQKTVDAAGPRAQGLLKDAGVFFSEAVKVVPPSEGSSSRGHVVAWDGLDIWTPAPEAEESGEYFEDKSTGAVKGKAAVGLGRTEAMLRRARTDASLYTVALTAEEEVEFAKLADADRKPVPDAEQEPEMRTLVAELVPEKMTADVFWARYRFRVHQVAQDEEKRKALLAAQAQNDEELFSWDDDEEAGSPSTASHAEKSLASSTSGISSSPAPTLKGASSVHRERDASESEASYDLVSGAASPAPAKKEDVKEAKGASPTTATAKKVDDEDGDSDWE